MGCLGFGFWDRTTCLKIIKKKSFLYVMELPNCQIRVLMGGLDFGNRAAALVKKSFLCLMELRY